MNRKPMRWRVSIGLAAATVALTARGGEPRGERAGEREDEGTSEDPGADRLDREGVEEDHVAPPDG